MMVLLIFVVALFVFGREHGVWIPTLKEVLRAMLWTIAAVVVGILVVGGYEAVVWAPATVLQNAVAKANQKYLKFL